MITQDDLRQDPHFLALDALLNGPAYSGRADHARQILVDWMKACQDAKPNNPVPVFVQDENGFEPSNKRPWWRFWG